MTDKTNEGGTFNDFRIDPATGKVYTVLPKKGGTEIGSVNAPKSTNDTETPERNEPETVVVQGKPGRSIQSADIVGNNLVLTFSDGSTYDVGNVRGPAGSGAAGNDGPGFVSAFINGTGHLILTKTDATTIDLGIVAGTNGTNGTDGANGKTILSGAVDPTTEGTNGDFYLNTVSMRLFGPKAAGAWTTGVLIKGVDGINGTNGKTILSGSGAPAGGIGSNGDFYIDTVAFELYGPKGTPSAGWNTPISIKGIDQSLVMTFDPRQSAVDQGSSLMADTIEVRRYDASTPVAPARYVRDTVASAGSFAAGGSHWKPIDPVVELEMFGAKGDGVTNDQDAWDVARVLGRPVMLTRKYLVSDPSNTMGIPLLGSGKLISAVPGGFIQANSTRDHGPQYFRSHLWRVKNRILTPGTLLKIVIMGDSTATNGYGLAIDTATLQLIVDEGQLAVVD